MALSGIVRAEGSVVTSGAASDYILIQKLINGQRLPRQITLSNLLAGGVDAPVVNIGASGTAGTLNIFPTTASKGKASFTVSDASGNTTTNINVAAQTGARTYTVPDAGASASLVMTEGAQTINGVKTFGSPALGLAGVATVYIPVISAQAGAVSVLFSAPFSGTITKIYASISGAIITTDIVITPSVYHSGSGTAVTNGAVTVALSGSGVGTTGSATPTAANTFVAGDAVTATITGGVNAVNGVITLLYTRTA